MSTDMPLEQRLHAIYAVTVPVALDRRVATAIAAVPQRRPGPMGRRKVVVLAIAAVVATVAAGPAASWFAGWDARYDRLWDLSIPVEQAMTVDDYRVTVERAYADALGVRLAMSAVDLKDRWSGMRIDTADVTDADGRVYQAWNWSTKTPMNATTASWSRFALPSDAPDDLGLQVTVTSLAVRLPEPIDSLRDPSRIWTSVDGVWTFDVDVPVTAVVRTIEPAVSASEGGVTVTLRELELVPSGVVARLAVRGLPALPAGSDWGWYPVLSAVHDGHAHSDDVFDPGVLADGDAITIEMVRDGGDDPIDDLTGRWKITIAAFWSSSDPRREGFGKDVGPWVLEVDVPADS